jgi:hypothetical protein
MKKVKWCWDYEVYVPFCPFCNEPAYEKDHCVFCGKEYKWVNKSKARTVTVEDYTIVQASNNHIQVYKGERMVMHLPCTKKMSKRKLRGYAAFCEGIREVGADHD